MRNVRFPILMVLAVIMFLGMAGPTEVVARRDGAKVTILDNCDPTDPAWTATGGCLLDEGDVTEAEFNVFLRSPLYDNDNDPLSTVGQFLVGHPSWRNDPSHVSVEAGSKLHVKNEGGRRHTFTPVAQFGGGRVPPLRVGTQMAPECAAPPAGQPDPYLVDPGAALKLQTAGEGIQRFQCCLHPWMRATVRVTPAEDQH
jgi:hypothetical protein